MNRRAFLQLVGVGAIARGFTGCSTSAEPAGLGASRLRGDPDWASLQRHIAGDVILPESGTYDRARVLYNKRFDVVRPAAVVACAATEDVREAIGFARRYGLRVAPRGGGHSYAGYSTTDGIVIDVSRIRAARVDGDVAIVGAGARALDMNDQLLPHGVAIPTGDCPTVGIAGLSMGGGLGPVGRKFGLVSDRMVEATVVTADGCIRVCNEDRHRDLFWALRGGGGGNFGVATSFTFRTHPTRRIVFFRFRWPWSEAGRVFRAWQKFGPKANDELWTMLQLRATSAPGEEPVIRIVGVYYGSDADLAVELRPFLAEVADPNQIIRRELEYRDALMVLARCEGLTVPQCHTAEQDPEGTQPRSLFAGKSDFFREVLPDAGVDAFIQVIERAQADNAGVVALCDAFGGALSRPRPHDTAFVHRDMRFSVQYFSGFESGEGPEKLEHAIRWQNTCKSTMSPWASGEAYQNYMDPDQPDWQHAYYGKNYRRLQRIKSAYDPDEFFRFAQSITPG